MARNLKPGTQLPYPLRRQWAYIPWITPEAANAMVASAWSDADAQRQLFETMLQTDADLRSAVRMRVTAISVADWQLELDGGEVLPIPGMTAAAEHLVFGLLFGVAAAEVVWDRDWRIRQIRPWPLGATRVSTGKISLLLSELREIDIDSIPGQVVVVTADRHDPASAAELRPLVLTWLSRMYLLRDWRRYAERYADPLIVVSPPEGVLEIDGEDAIDVYTKIAATAKLSGVLGLVPGSNVEILSDSRSDATTTFRELWKVSTEAVYRGIVGDSEIALAGPDGSRAATEVRYRQLDVLAERDAVTIRNAMQQCVDSALSGTGITAMVRYSWQRDTTPAELAALYLVASQAGILFDPEEAARSLGLPLPGEKAAMSRRDTLARRQPVRRQNYTAKLDSYAREQARLAAKKLTDHYRQILREHFGGSADKPANPEVLKLSENPPPDVFRRIHEAINGAIIAGAGRAED